MDEIEVRESLLGPWERAATEVRQESFALVMLFTDCQIVRHGETLLGNLILARKE